MSNRFAIPKSLKRADLLTVAIVSLLLGLVPGWVKNSGDEWEGVIESQQQEVAKKPAASKPARNKGTRTTTAKNKVAVRFLHMNLENYMVNEEPKRSKQESKYKSVASREAVARVIAEAKPDLVSVCEVGGQISLNDLKKRLGKQGLDYPYQAVVERVGEERALGILSRYPIVKNNSSKKVSLPNSLADGPRDMLRGILDVTVKTDDNREFRLIGVHLKSRLNGVSRTESVRRREAQAIRSRLDKAMLEDPDLPILVSGDFNDGPTDPSVELVRGTKSSDRGMFRVRPVDSRGEAWTITHDEVDAYYSYDHILVNDALRDRIGGSKASCGIVDIPESSQASDHRAVWVDLK
jgi:endonuclease/exonuclease/phosphatase family metal-dependent hydrolase